MYHAASVLLVVGVASIVLTNVSGKRDQRMAGMDLNDWCDNSVCLIPGSSCVTDAALAAATGFTLFCKCKAEFVEYASVTGSTKDRCAAKAATALTATECEWDSDCQNYGKNIACKFANPDDRFGKCACNQGYVFEAAVTGGICKVFNCYDDATPNQKCESILKGSTCVPKAAPANAGKCMCPAGKILSGGDCKDMAIALACNEAANQYCPATGTGTLTCVNNKCVCQLKTASGATIAASPMSNPDNQAQVDCKANTIGSECSGDDQCPTNAACKGGSAPNTKGRCICKDFHKVVPMGTLSTCEPAVGACCRGAADCGMQPTGAGAKGLVCLKPYPGDPRGVCNCPKGMGWSPADRNCAAAC